MILDNPEFTVDNTALVMQEMMQTYARQDWELVDLWIASVPMSHHEGWLITVARMTYQVRIKLNNWKDYVISIREELRRRGLDADLLLRGLL